MDNTRIELKVQLDEGAYMPEKAHDADAGFDLRTRETAGILPGGSAIFDTGVHIEIPEGYVGFLKAKSGLNVRENIVGTGVIDSGYSGSIVVKLYNLGDSTYVFEQGAKIIQLVILPIPFIDLVRVEEISGGERGNKGFGSSGR